MCKKITWQIVNERVSIRISQTTFIHDIWEIRLPQGYVGPHMQQQIHKCMVKREGINQIQKGEYRVKRRTQFSMVKIGVGMYMCCCSVNLYKMQQQQQPPASFLLWKLSWIDSSFDIISSNVGRLSGFLCQHSRRSLNQVKASSQEHNQAN